MILSFQQSSRRHVIICICPGEKTEAWEAQRLRFPDLGLGWGWEARLAPARAKTFFLPTLTTNDIKHKHKHIIRQIQVLLGSDYPISFLSMVSDSTESRPAGTSLLGSASGEGILTSRSSRPVAQVGNETVTNPCVLVFWSKMLTQELMTGKWEDVETKNSCWTRELVTI